MKKVVIELNYDDNGNGIGDMMNSINNVLKGHAPYLDNDIILGTDKPFDGEFKGDKVILSADFNSKNAAKHGTMSDMVMAAMIPILNTITNGDESNNGK